MVKAGRLNSPVTIKRQSNTQDDIGQRENTWEKLGTSMASIDPVRGSAYMLASGEKASITHEIHMRARDDFTLMARDRLYYGARRFDVQNVLNAGEQNREWIVMCIEQLATKDD